MEFALVGPELLLAFSLGLVVSLVILITYVGLIVSSALITQRVPVWIGGCLMIGSVLLAAFRLASMPAIMFFIARALPPEQFGRFFQWQSYVSLVAMLIFSIGFFGLSRYIRGDRPN